MANFDYTPIDTAQLLTGFRYLDTPFENGSYQRYYKGTKPKEWILRFRQKSSDMAGLRTFFENHNDAANWSFTFDCPYDSITYTVCFSNPSELSWSLYAPSIEEVEVRLKEIT